ncbi:response regulator transcription factor [Tessaracoccus sp. MC1627]|uniref:response regulator n=1 Tax=Tessaracoccus sp. MC1627 TaxID=2760312 RepID=UPI001601D1C2|nr:response regulator transcription factor [Tessaracoccus sp. MC1627]MBB1513386.1 response regulator transcription factor [Tessaracoccus sp. MC1627]
MNDHSDPASRPVPDPIRVLLVDDQALVRMGFRLVLESQQDLEVVGEAGDGDTAVALAHQLGPDVVLLDVQMPGRDGIQATALITEQVPASRVLILTTFDLDEYVYAALRAGASGFLLKDALPAEMISAVRAVAAGDAVLAPRITKRLLEKYAQQLPLPSADRDQTRRHPRLASLTEREFDVLAHVARGLTNAEIASHLGVSPATVKTHVGSILTKLGVRDRVQAVIIAYETGLVASS